MSINKLNRDNTLYRLSHVPANMLSLQESKNYFLFFNLKHEDDFRYLL